MTCRIIYALLSAFGLLAAAASGNPAAAAQSAMACDTFARNYATNTSHQGQVLGRGAVGSALGAGIGAAFGGPAVGAAVGGGIGLISGGARRKQTSEKMYNAAYQDCMAGRVR
jgi:Glycine zipper